MIMASHTISGSWRPLAFGVAAGGLLLAVYFGTLSVLSGWSFSVDQFKQFWFYILPLAAGFALQVALFQRLREIVNLSKDAGAVVATSGTTSTAAMVSCCAHYLANVAPVLGASGLVAFAAQYQVEFFWVGLLLNLAGIAYIGSKVFKATKEHEQCLA
jgi:P-type Cu+ transporter